jgi:endonuclease/exonuclease/phosphatase family metal-dependent hydrolase
MMKPFSRAQSRRSAWSLGASVVVALSIAVWQFSASGCEPFAPISSEREDQESDKHGNWWEEAVEAPPTPYRAASYLLCFWNLENYFDDHDDHRTGADKEYDEWFAEDHQDLETKIRNLSKALLALNGGRGPDILAVAEVETERAARFLMNALNHGLKDPNLRYRHLLFKEVSAGRHIATAIITRLNVEEKRTQLLDKKRRTLEGHLIVDGHELVLIASHWTSRLTDRDGKEDSGRAKYASEIYGRFNAMYHSNPKVDLVVCGDFNDGPKDKSVVEHLHAVGSERQVLSSSRDEPRLLDLFADKDPRTYGTHYDEGRWAIFDQIVVSPGLLDNEGWKCDVDSAQAVRTLVRKGDRIGQPWRFGNRKHGERERGYSDHFPVTAVLKVVE